MGEGRSDSCCVYTGVKYTNPNLQTAVESYIWPAVKDLVNDNFVPLGFFKVCNKPLWAMPMPEANKEKTVLGRSTKGSAGGLMGNILARAYTNSMMKTYRNADELTVLAKAETRSIIQRLYS